MWLTRRANHLGPLCVLVLSEAGGLLSNRFLMLWLAMLAHVLMLLSVHAQMC